MENNYAIIKFKDIKDSAGFFSNYFSVISTMMIIVNNGIIPYVDASNTWFNPTCDFLNNKVEDETINPWNWWFDQTVDLNHIVQEVHITRELLTHNPLHFANQDNLGYAREIAQEFCKIKTEILLKAQNLYNANIEGKETLGILARGTEMLYHHLEYPKIQINDWVSVISNYIEKYPEIKNIFLVSDDMLIIDEIVKHFPNTVYIKEFFRRTTQPEELLQSAYPPWWLTSYNNDPNHLQKLGEETLIQSLLLSKCNHFIGSCSGISNAVQFFNNNTFKSYKIV